MHVSGRSYRPYFSSIVDEHFLSKRCRCEAENKALFCVFRRVCSLVKPFILS
jgi:hypothetical protein